MAQTGCNQFQEAFGEIPFIRLAARSAERAGSKINKSGISYNPSIISAFGVCLRGEDKSVSSWLLLFSSWIVNDYIHDVLR